MYHQHFGLSGPPFRFTPMPDALYLGKTHREALAALEWGLLREPTGFTLLVGESGVGKTTLVCSLLARRYESVRAAFITNPRLNFEQLLQVALSQLAPSTRGQGKLELTQNLVRLLGDLAPGQRVALILDESQDLSDETLEELRLLSNFDDGTEHHLQLIFVGQPELMGRLGRMRSLNERIGARALLKPLSVAEMREYVDCRLRAKGGKSRKIFASEALKYLMAHSRGIPRRINVLCHNAMLLAYAAGTTKVTLAMARNSVNDYEDLLGNEGPGEIPIEAVGGADRPARWIARGALAVSALALVALGAVYLWSTQVLSASSITHSAIAIRSAAGSKTTGPGTLPRPVASASDASGGGAVNIVNPRFRAPRSPVDGRPAQSVGDPGTRTGKAGADDSTVIRTPAPHSAADPVWRSATGASEGGTVPAGDVEAAAGMAAADDGGSPASAHSHSVRVRAGDSMWLIAIRNLGSSSKLSQLLRANPQLQNVDRIYPGETVFLPPARTAVAN